MARHALRGWDAFGIVGDVARDWPDVEAATKYDGSPVLKCGGCFMAGMAVHESSEIDTLVVRIDVDARPALIEDAPETYYLTAYYEPHPVVLARLARIDGDALRDLLAMARRATLLKASRSRG
ncbi:MAG: MmcQ/YjbR family DNA-binding protein [Vicinamibacteraceae bacterium]